MERRKTQWEKAKYAGGDWSRRNAELLISQSFLANLCCRSGFLLFCECVLLYLRYISEQLLHGGDFGQVCSQRLKQTKRRRDKELPFFVCEEQSK